MISDEPEGASPDINEAVKEFEAHLAQLNEAANAKVEAAITALIERVDGKLPPKEEIAVKGAIVRIEGWPRVTFFTWRRRHVLAWFIDLTQDGAPTVVIKEVPKADWPKALSEYVDFGDVI